MDNTLFKTDRLTIREADDGTEKRAAAVNNEDLSAETLFSTIQDEAVAEAIKDTEAVLAFVRSLVASRDSTDKKRFSAWDRTGDLVAYAGATSWSTGAPELQITVMPEFQGQGYATEFLSALIPWAFQNYDLDHFIYRHLVDNVRSGRLVAKLGGVLQEPNSPIEGLTSKTYFIYR